MPIRTKPADAVGAEGGPRRTDSNWRRSTHRARRISTLPIIGDNIPTGTVLKIRTMTVIMIMTGITKTLMIDARPRKQTVLIGEIGSIMAGIESLFDGLKPKGVR